MTDVRSALLALALLVVSGSPAAPQPPNPTDASHLFSLQYGKWRMRYCREIRGAYPRECVGARARGFFTARPLRDSSSFTIEWEARFEEDPSRLAGAGRAIVSYESTSARWTIQESPVSEPLSGPMRGRAKEDRWWVFENMQKGNPAAPRVRFLWSMVSLNEARWNRETSVDGGGTWETDWAMHLWRVADTTTEQDIAKVGRQASRMCCRVVEMSLYTAAPEQGDTLVHLFNREKQVLGDTGTAQDIALYRNMEQPGTYVWLRAFHGSEEDDRALRAFYMTPTWDAHRTAITRGNIRIDKVYLLRPGLSTSLGLSFDEQAPGKSAQDSAPIIVATIYQLNDPFDRWKFSELFLRYVAPELAAAGGRPEVALESSSAIRWLTEADETGRPKSAVPGRPLPEDAVVVLAWFADVARYQRFAATFQRNEQWRTAIGPALRAYLKRPPTVWRLVAVARSGLVHPFPVYW